MSTISRRETLTWMSAALASPWVVGAAEPAFAQGDTGLWKEVEIAPITASGYGSDPNLLKPSVPWPLTLTGAQRATLRIAADLMLPADERSDSGSALGLDAFIDEWVSAPYPDQQRDRKLILSGLAWLDAESNARFGHGFAAATDSERRAIPGHSLLRRLRGLTAPRLDLERGNDDRSELQSGDRAAASVDSQGIDAPRSTR